MFEDSAEFIAKSVVPHQKKVLFDKQFVVLTGLLDEEKLKERLSSKTLEVEVSMILD